MNIESNSNYCQHNVAKLQTITSNGVSKEQETKQLNHSDVYFKNIKLYIKLVVSNFLGKSVLGEVMENVKLDYTIKSAVINLLLIGNRKNLTILFNLKENCFNIMIYLIAIMNTKFSAFLS